MKKVILAIGTILITSNVMAATSATLHLAGVVPKKLDISIDIANATLDLSVNKTDFKVATVREKSNSNNGYKVTVASANLGKLKRTGGAEVFSYSAKYGASAVGLGSAAGTTLTRTTSGVVNTTQDVLLSYTGALPETMVEGSYEDTITFTIAAN